MKLLLLLLLAALVSYGIARLLIPVALRVGWVDKPSDRKRHDGEIPLVGGAAVFLTLCLFFYFGSGWANHTVGLAMAVGLMVLVGGFDDMFPVRARYRFVAQLVAAVAVTFAGGVTVTQLGQCFAPFELGLGLLAVPFTMVCITGLINAYNMSDGLDGLCGGHALIALGWFALAALLANGRGGAAFTEVAPVVVPAIGAVIGFLALNARGFWRARAAIFLGDGGSMVLGLIVAWTAIMVSQPYPGSAVTPAAAVWVVAVPVADMFACMVRRVLEGKTPMTADRHHVHHLLLALGASANGAVRILHGISLAFGAIGIGGAWLGVPEYLLFWALVLSFGAYLMFSIEFWRRHEARQSEAASRPAAPSAVGQSPVRVFE